MRFSTVLYGSLLSATLLTMIPTDLLGALEHGHVRARTRGYQQGPKVDEPVVETEIRKKVVPDSPVTSVESADPEISSPVVPRHQGMFSNGLRFWKKDSDRFKIKNSGYLAFGPPNALRFSDDEEVNRRPPSPALPEFNFLSDEYVPYLVETPLENGGIDSAMINEIVIELETHSVVSGMIDTRRADQEDQVEHFNLEENRTTILRPEEVLIFFETDGVSGDTRAIVPFSPATPSNSTIKSSATLKQE